MTGSTAPIETILPTSTFHIPDGPVSPLPDFSIWDGNFNFEAAFDDTPLSQVDHVVGADVASVRALCCY